MYSRFMDLVEANHQRAHERKRIRTERNRKVLQAGSVAAIVFALVSRYKSKS
jgi:hypothetical protein